MLAFRSKSVIPTTNPTTTTEPPVGAGHAPDAQASAQLDPAQQRQLAEAEVRFALTFTRILSVLARTPHYRGHTIADLDWLLVPPVMLGQCAVMETTAPNGQKVPVAAALWALVSPDVDQRLAQHLDQPLRLVPNEWRCGEILWLVDAFGDTNAIPHLMKMLRESAFRDQPVKVRTTGADGRAELKVLRP